MKKLLVWGVIIAVVVIFWDKIKATASSLVAKLKGSSTTPAA